MNLTKASPIEVADEIIANSARIVACGNTLYIFTGKRYEEWTERSIGQAVYDLYVKYRPDAWSPMKSKAIAEAIRYHPEIDSVEQMDEYDNYINLRNGVLRFSDRMLMPHDDTYLFTTYADVDYDPEAEATPTMDELLYSIFTLRNGKPDIHTIDNILQLGGYLIYPKIKMEKMFIFYGTGSNGKSMIIDYLFKPFFDKAFISALSLNTLSNESSPSRKALMYSRVNFATEQKAGDLESEELKKVITGEMISIERKYLDTITITPRAKIVVAGNRFVRFKDTSEGTRRRLMIFNFANRFETNLAKYKEIKNPQLRNIYPAKPKDEIVRGLNAERSAILNAFLDGLQRLKDNNWQFIESANNTEIFDEYINESDYLGAWLEMSLKIKEPEDDDAAITVKDIQTRYRGWWDYNFPDKRFDVSVKMMSKRIKDLFRIEPKLVNIQQFDGHRSTTTAYELKWKNTTENQDWQKQNSLL